MYCHFFEHMASYATLDNQKLQTNYLNLGTLVRYYSHMCISFTCVTPLILIDSFNVASSSLGLTSLHIDLPHLHNCFDFELDCMLHHLFLLHSSSLTIFPLDSLLCFG